MLGAIVIFLIVALVIDDEIQKRRRAKIATEQFKRDVAWWRDRGRD